MKKFVLLLSIVGILFASSQLNAQKPYINGELYNSDSLGQHWYVLDCFDGATRLPLTVHSRLMAFPDTTVTIQDTTFQSNTLCIHVYFPPLQYYTTYYYSIVYTNDSGSCCTYGQLETEGPLAIPGIETGTPVITYGNGVVEIRNFDRIGRLALYDLLGQEMLSQHISQGHSLYNIVQLETGEYIAALFDEEGNRVSVRKIIK